MVFLQKGHWNSQKAKQKTKNKNKKNDKEQRCSYRKDTGIHKRQKKQNKKLKKKKKQQQQRTKVFLQKGHWNSQKAKKTTKN